MTKELSSAAKAVLDAYRDADIDDHVTAAAVLRAVADHDPDGNTTDEYDAGWRAAMDFIDAIAAELEALYSDQSNET